MQLRELIVRTSIAELWRYLGGGNLKGQRGQAFWRESSDFNISLNEDQGTYYDFAVSKGGGILDLILTIRGCDRKEAVRVLCNFHGEPLFIRTSKPPKEWTSKEYLELKRYEEDRKTAAQYKLQLEKLRDLHRYYCWAQEFAEEQGRKMTLAVGNEAIEATLMRWECVWLHINDKEKAKEIHELLCLLARQKPDVQLVQALRGDFEVVDGATFSLAHSGSRPVEVPYSLAAEDKAREIPKLFEGAVEPDRLGELTSA